MFPGEGDAEGAAVPDLGLKVDRSAQGGDQLAYQGEPDTGARGVLVGDRFEQLEGLEDARLVFDRDARSGVDHRDLTVDRRSIARRLLSSRAR